MLIRDYASAEAFLDGAVSRSLCLGVEVVRTPATLKAGSGEVVRPEGITVRIHEANLVTYYPDGTCYLFDLDLTAIVDEITTMIDLASHRQAKGILDRLTDLTMQGRKTPPPPKPAVGFQHLRGPDAQPPFIRFLGPVGELWWPSGNELAPRAATGSTDDPVALEGG